MENELIQTLGKFGLFAVSFAELVVVIAALVTAIRLTLKKVYLLAAWLMLAGWFGMFIVRLIRLGCFFSVQTIIDRLGISGWEWLFIVMNILSFIACLVMGTGILLLGRLRSGQARP